MKKEIDNIFANKKILVVGAGISGLWSIRWLSRQGAVLTVSDVKAEADLDHGILREFRELGVKLETGCHDRDSFLNSDMIVLSPGVPHDTELLNAAREKGISIIGEMELAGRFTDTPVIAVTGTNGKTTVTTMIGNLLENAGFNVFVGGNIGTPLTAYVAGEKKADYAVVEVSSFQLDTTEAFSPYISIILNISPDHLDRYVNLRAYAESKLRIFENQRKGQFLILNDGDPLLKIRPASDVTVYKYGYERKKGRHAFVMKGVANLSMRNKKSSQYQLDSFNPQGRHNIENLLAVLLVSEILEIDQSVVRKTIQEFRSLPNRLEYVGEVDGVAFYNDSKATNVDAAVKAIMSFERPLLLIAGGRHKGSDYSALVDSSLGKVKEAVFIGEATCHLIEWFEGKIPYSVSESMEDAVKTAFSRAKKGDVVLLAPACSSFDMFSSYAQRGEIFRKTVGRLKDGS